MSKVPSLTPRLQLALAFLNTYDLLEDPPDLLTVARLQRIGNRFGFADLTGPIDDAGLPELRRVRGKLYRAFAGETHAEKIGAVNHALATLDARASIAADADTFCFTTIAAPGADPVRAFGVHVTDGVAQAFVAGGPDRLGICAGTPCRCVFVDRTRAIRQRYCCELCNDRMAAAAYRARSMS